MTACMPTVTMSLQRARTDYQQAANELRLKAEAVRDFLISNGIAPERISAQGTGEDYPVATNSTVAGRQQNRRVEVTIAEAPEIKAHTFSRKGMQSHDPVIASY